MPSPGFVTRTLLVCSSVCVIVPMEGQSLEVFMWGAEQHNRQRPCSHTGLAKLPSRKAPCKTRHQTAAPGSFTHTETFTEGVWNSHQDTDQE